jgi:tetratricopeptide (TPR) repeat protein
VAETLQQAVALHQQGRLDEAERLYRQAIAAAPRDFDALHLLGMLELQRGRHADATSFLDRAIAIEAGHPFAQFHLACALHELKRLPEAVAHYDRAVALKPDFAEAFNNRGNALRALGRREEALASFDRAVALKPDFLLAQYNRGNLLRDLGRYDAALASCDRALALKPDFVEALHNRGFVLAELKRYAEALASYDRVLALKPDYVEALDSRGNLLRKLDRHDEALASYARALALRPNYAAAFTDRGNALSELGRLGEAIADYDHALALEPDQVEALSNRGNALRNLLRCEDALASYDRAIARDPGNADAHANAGWTRLLLGDFASGWDEFEWRWRTRQMATQRRDFVQPPWRGAEPLAGKTILLHAEQAFGDTILFCRYATEIAKRGATVVLEVQPALQSLLAGLEGADRVIARGQALPEFDYHCPLLSLPLALKTDLASIPARVPYLAADGAKIAAWRARLGPSTRQRVGIAWSSTNRAHSDLAKRSLPLDALASLRNDGVELVSLQKELSPADEATLSQWGDVRHVGDALADFSDTAALIATLDFVISIDTAVAHLAGALGKPVSILLAFAPDWRWLLGRDDSPWYPTARLFRQPAPDDWASVVARVAAELDASIAPHPNPPPRGGREGRG